MIGEVLVNLLGQFAERRALRTRNDRLLAEKCQLAWNLELIELLSRAIGIVAVKRGVTSESAHEWLCNESLRVRLPLWQVAERLIQGEALVRGFHERNQETGLRLTA
jgi:AmiR/NasT family two-component response regulator